MRVLVIGAGPTGLTAAVELARCGIVPEVVERREGPSTLSRAVGINARSRALLAPSGVAARLVAEGIAVREAVFHDGARPLARLRIDRLDPPHDYMLALPQDRTEEILRDRLAELGGEVRFGVACEGLAEAEGVEARLSTSVERYDRVIGADGAHGMSRDAIGAAFEGIDLPGEWSVADFEVSDWPDPRAASVFLLEDGNAAFVIPIGEGRYRAVTTTPDAIRAVPREISAARVRREGRFRVSVRQASHYAKGGVFLAGDAAHCHSPVGGRGMNLGIEDACDLARRIVEGEEAGYGPARIARGREVIALSERGRRVATARSRIARLARRAAIRLAARSDLAQRRIARMVLDPPEDGAADES